jgi:hypothetical protein
MDTASVLPVVDTIYTYMKVVEQLINTTIVYTQKEIKKLNRIKSNLQRSDPYFNTAHYLRIPIYQFINASLSLVMIFNTLLFLVTVITFLHTTDDTHSVRFAFTFTADPF